jgi:biopolymer transport protein ExbB
MNLSGALSTPCWIRWAGICLLALLLLGFASPAVTPVHAQEGGGDAQASKDSGGGQSTNLFIHIVKSAGPFMGAILGFLSIALVTMIVLLALDLRMGAAIPPGFVEDFTETVNQRKFKEAYEMSREDGSFLGRVLTTGMSRLQYGIEDARESAFNMVESIKAGKEQLISYLATIGTLGPLLGLIGTVYGMILAFRELGKEGETPKPQKLADSLSHALVVTMLGIGLSVPAIFAHTFFRNRLIRLTMDTSNIADDLLTQMYHNSKKAAPAGVAQVPQPAATDSRGVPTQPAAIKK